MSALHEAAWRLCRSIARIGVRSAGAGTQLGATLAILAGLALAGPANAYDESRVVLSAQQALIRLGYDPGPADGAWGRKTRDALNALREAEGLPPADDLTASSLALVHGLSPGETTLPRPGFMFTDIAARREVLSDPANSQTRRKQCITRLGAGIALDKVEPVPQLEMIIKAQDYISESEDWYSDIQESLLGATNGCISGKLPGNDGQCRSIVDFAMRWAEADALRPVRHRTHGDFLQTIWIGNVVLRNTIVAYGIARQLHEISPAEEAVVLDWFKRRIDENHHLQPDLVTTNHALADMSPAFAFGVLVGDRTMMEPALDVWRKALASMRADGSLPMESRRGARWAHYTNVAIGQLLFVAELAAGQDIDVYAMSPSPEKTVQRAIGWLFDGLADFDVARPYAKENHGSPGNYRIPYFDVYHYGWLPAYHARFGDDETMTRIGSATVDPEICSPEALDEEKTFPQACQSFTGEPVSVARALLSAGLKPYNHMAYPAGCVQGVGPSPFEGVRPE